MRSRVTLALLAAAILLVAGCGRRARPPEVAPPAPRPAAPLSGAPLEVRTGSGVRAVPLEEYVAGCVLAELGTPGGGDAQAGRRMLAVQAILCRSFAVASRGRHASAGFDLCATTHCQLYRPVPATEAGRRARAAAEDTRGLVLEVDGRAIQPVYHAHCGGATSGAQDVWSGPPVRWLVSMKEEGCAGGAAWSFRVDLARLGRALAADGRLALRLPLRDVSVERRDEAGRAALLRLQGGNAVVVRSDQFRAAVLKAFGARSLASTMFSVTRTGRALTFTGHGYGHGVGLCQAGALRLATRGRDAEAILQHYFPGARLGKVESPM